MHTAVLERADDFDGWRTAARTMAVAGVSPDDIVWQVGTRATDLLGGIGGDLVEGPAFGVPKAFLDLARRVICHRDPERFTLLYAALSRLRLQPRLLEDPADPLVIRLAGLAKSVGRDVHKMRAFVRFREVTDPDGERFAAWFEPEHHIVRLNAGFFARRFTNMRWSILTPEECVHWDGEALRFTPGATRTDAPDGDPVEETWRTYFSSIFNPARLKVKAMTAEMPKKYWKNLPEAALVPGLIAGAEERTRMMIAAGQEVGMSNDDLLAGVEVAGAKEDDDAKTIDQLRAAAAGCTRCPLYLPATQTVFGEGPPTARLVFVGEQPGDQEDLAGRPFVGPAGQVFDRALAAAGIDRTTTYVTNAVKHFKFEQRGKRRIHAKPGTGEIDACRWWLDHERALIAPLVTVALGATAARSLTGKTMTISRERGRPLTLADGSEAWITVHPSFLLRIEDRAAADAEFDRFVADLVAVRQRLAALA